MKRNRILLLAAVLLMTMSLCFALTSCGGDTQGTESDSKATESTPAESGEGQTTDETQPGQTSAHVHTIVTDAAIAPTCTETGLTEGNHCSTCGKVLVAQETVPVKKHTYVNCICKDCGKELEPSEGLAFELNSDGESYAVVGIGTCTDTDILIPSTHDGKLVTRIGDFAFHECSDLTSVTIPNSVTSIGECAFRICRSLTSIVIPDSVASIGYDAFSWCSSLMSIVIPDSVTSISDCAFQGCDSLTSVVIGNSVTSIGYDVFTNCWSLTSITYQGTQTQWNAIEKAYSWNYDTGSYTIYCTDGEIKK